MINSGPQHSPFIYRRSRQGDVHRGNRHWCLKMGKVHFKIKQDRASCFCSSPKFKKDQDNCRNKNMFQGI